jgi:hypothetical protein
VWTDDATNGAIFTVKEETVLPTEYNVEGLTQGSSYQFKVETRNAYGFSEFSNTVTIIAAQVPA